MMVREDMIKLQCVPLGKEINVWTVAVAPQVSDDRKKQIRGHFGSGAEIHFVVKPATWINEAIEEKYPRQDRAETQAESQVREIVQTARRLRATDILIEPFPGRPAEYAEFASLDVQPECTAARVRFGIEGLFTEHLVENRLKRAFFRTPDEFAKAIRVVKSNAELSSDTMARDADGRITFSYDGISTEYRVGLIPTRGGQQALTLRQIASSSEVRSIDALSAFPRVYGPVVNRLSQSGKFVLIAGPQRSGKTTTAYALLLAMPQTMHVITVEQPPEANLEPHGITQIPIGGREPDLARRGGESFRMSDAIASLTRNTVNLIMVGEIRDKDTMREALKAASSGTSVLATIHADRAADVLDRVELLEGNRSGVERTISMIVAQRLIRRVCNADGCATRLSKHRVEANAEGCPVCHFRGYSGEVVILDIKDLRRDEPMLVTMEAMAQRCVDLGITDEAEIHRVIGAPEPDRASAADDLFGTGPLSLDHAFAVR